MPLLVETLATTAGAIGTKYELIYIKTPPQTYDPNAPANYHWDAAASAWWVYYEQPADSVSSCGSKLNFGSAFSPWGSPTSGAILCVLQLPFRFPQLDRCPWGSAQVVSASANISPGSLAYSQAYLTGLYTADDQSNFAQEEVSPGVWEFRYSYHMNNGQYYTRKYGQGDDVNHGSLALTLAGLVTLDGGSYAVRPIGQITTVTVDEASNVRHKINAAGLVKAYLDSRNYYDAFVLLAMPGDESIELANASDWEALRTIWAASAADARTWVWMSELGEWIFLGKMATRYVTWSQLGIDNLLVNFDLSAWNLDRHSRAQYATAPGQV
jgi:hypothetical protein